MLATVTLEIDSKSATLTLSRGQRAVESECWTFPGKVTSKQAAEIASLVFHDNYDFLNFSVHGDDDE